ncbi:hypothetical protein ACVWY2_007310 [Bradyrhizobium sp. JR6.1]
MEAVARHAGGQPADPFGDRIRQVGDHVPQQALSRLQGAPAAGARRSDPAIRPDPRGGARLRAALPRAGRLRGRRSDRDLCAARHRARRDHDDRVIGQGSDAARQRQGRDVRHDEGSPHRPRRGDREIRRAAREGRRGAGAGRRFHRQRAGRARHRHQDRGAIDHRVWRSRSAAVPRRRDQAAEAARGAARERREGARLAPARAARRQGRSRGAARRPRGARARLAPAGRLPEGDGVLHPHPPRRRLCADRPRQCRCRSRQQERRQRVLAAAAIGCDAGAGQRTVSRRAGGFANEGARQADRRTRRQELQPEGHAGNAGRGPRRSDPQDRLRSQGLPGDRQSRSAQRLCRARARHRLHRDRGDVGIDRPDAGRTVGTGARRGAQRRLLHPAQPPAGRWRRRAVRCGPRARPDQDRRGTEGAEAAAGVRRHPEGRLRRQVHLGDLGAARRHAAQHR